MESPIEEGPNGRGAGWGPVGHQASLTCTGDPPSSSSSWAVRMADAATSSCVDWAPCLEEEAMLSTKVRTEPKSVFLALGQTHKSADYR